jgi:hypothetical protein
MNPGVKIPIWEIKNGRSKRFANASRDGRLRSFGDSEDDQKSQAFSS